MAIPVLNTYFVVHGVQTYRRVRPRSPLLLSLLVVKVTVWLIGIFVAVVAFRVVSDQPPLPFGGIGLGLVLVAVSLLPGFIHLQVRRIERGGG